MRTTGLHLHSARIYYQQHHTSLARAEGLCRGSCALCSVQGVGSSVIGAMLAAVAAAGVRRLWCNARVEQVGFYRKRGMEVSPRAGGQSPVAQALVIQRGR